MNKNIDIQEIMKLLPHRYPFLMIDKVISYKSGEHLTAIKNVTINESFFQGHFPQKPVMPGVMILEAMAQATGILGAISNDYDYEKDDSLYYFVGIDDARFKKIVSPGDQIEIFVEFIKIKRGIYYFSGKVMVDGKVVCQANLMCTRKVG